VFFDLHAPQGAKRSQPSAEKVRSPLRVRSVGFVGCAAAVGIATRRARSTARAGRIGHLSISERRPVSARFVAANELVRSGPHPVLRDVHRRRRRDRLGRAWLRGRQSKRALTMLQRSNTARVLCPLICVATRSGIPARTELRTAVRRKSCGNRPPAGTGRAAWGRRERDESAVYRLGCFCRYSALLRSSFSSCCCDQ
jgi:hypothetical protein